MQDNWPAVILLTTDGLPTSYRSDEDFHAFAGDLLGVLRSRGRGYVQRNLRAMLRHASDRGSGDDITVVAACRRDAVKSLGLPGSRRPARRAGQTTEQGRPRLARCGADTSAGDVVP
jgi:hypothetical protein